MIIQSILDLPFQTIISDVSGVMFDEVTCFPNVNHTFAELQKQNKQLILLSNAPRKEDFLREKLKKAGFAFYNDVPVLTSGMFFLEEIKKKFQKQVKYCTVGEGASDLLDSNFFLKTSIEEAEICIIYYMGYEESYAKEIKKIVEREIPVYCVNPDVKIETPEGVKFCAGKTAKMIEAEGGSVMYYGKPHVEIFSFLQEKYNFKKEETCIIGDSMVTDIIGAKNFGIQSVLVMGGIYKNFLNSDSSINKKNLDLLFSKFNFLPSFVINYI